MDANEEIAIAWIENLKSMFTRSELYFGKKHSDIDILAVSIIDSVVWDCEVKVRTGSTKMDNKSSKEIIRKYKEPCRIELIKKLVGGSLNIQRKLLISKKYFGSTPETIEKWERVFTSENIEVIYFESIITELKEFSRKCRKTTNSIIQTLKLSHQ